MDRGIYDLLERVGRSIDDAYWADDLCKCKKASDCSPHPPAELAHYASNAKTTLAYLIYDPLLTMIL